MVMEVLAHFLDVFAVLAAARVAAPGGGGEDCDTAVSVIGELEGNVVGVGLPVAVAEVDRDVDATECEFGFDVGDDFAVAVVEWAVSVEVVVVNGYFIEPFGRDPPASGDVF